MAGAVSVVLLVLGLVLGLSQGAPPALDAGTNEIQSYFSDNETLARASGFFNVIPILTLPIFFAGIYLTYRDRAGAGSGWIITALVGFVVLGVFSTVQGASAFAIALGVSDEFGGQPAVAGALFDLYNALAPATALSMALLLWSVANCFVRGPQIGPSWLRPTLLVGAAAAALSALAPFLEIDALAFLGLLAFIIFIVWVGVASMDLMRGRTGATT